MPWHPRLENRNLRSARKLEVYANRDGHMNDLRRLRLQVMVSRPELSAIDEFQSEQRLPAELRPFVNC
jgi:hypothetical protein